MNERANRLQNGSQLAIHIGELLVDAPCGIDRERLAAAVQAELGRLVGEQGVHLASATHARLDGGTIAPSGTAGHTAGDSADLGRSVARAVHGAIGGRR